MPEANSRRWYNIAVVAILLCWAGVWLASLQLARRNPTTFDDSYMFARYAANLRHGHGFSWNADGIPTYGPTSLLWTFVVTFMSLLPMKAWTMLSLTSWLCSAGAVVAMSWAIARNARHGWMASTWRLSPLVLIPLTSATVFMANGRTGMETMLAMLLMALFTGETLAWGDGRAPSYRVALLGLLLFLTRPESGLVVVAMPSLLALLRSEEPAPHKPSLGAVLALFAAGVAATLLLCHLYFKTALPLSFYMKGHQAYKGYAEMWLWHPGLQVLTFLTGCQLFLAVLLLLARRRDTRMVLSCVIPVALIMLYLQTVTQIMGFNARYYAPYLPLLVVPALLLVDRQLSADTWPAPPQGWRIAATGTLLFVLLITQSENVADKLRRLGGRTHIEYPPVRMVTPEHVALPTQEWSRAMTTITDELAAKLPAGTTVAATEVGYLGALAPQVNVIDMAGLNDTEIALHGFEPKALLDRKPDFIWLPHTAYTWERGRLLTEPRLLQEYEVYDGAAMFGIAVRKDSRFHDAIEEQLHAYWKVVYPGTRPEDYRATAMRWDETPFEVKDK